MKGPRDVSGLPVWARNEIERLRADLAASEERLAYAVGEIESAIEVDPTRAELGRPRCFLRRDSYVRFKLYAQEHIDVRLTVNGEVEITSVSHIGSEMVILPDVSNVVRVRTVPRR